MEVLEVIGMIDRLIRVDVGSSDRAGVEAVLGDTSRVQRWLDSVKVAAARRLRQLAADDATVYPEGAAASATKGSQSETDTLFKRADTADQVPQLADALDDGTVSGAHLDVVARALRGLEPDDRALLAGDGDWLATIAARSTPDQFARAVRQRVNRIRTDNGIARFERQRRATRLRTWTDRDTGMICLRGEFDPESGLALLARIHNTLDTLYHDTIPDTCPTDPQAKQDHLRALALLALSQGHGSGGRPDITIVIDLDTIVNGTHRHTHTDCGHPDIDLPIDTIRRFGCYADITYATTRNGVVLNLGRTQRLANRAQRRALRAMYPTCAVPGCNVHYQHCQPHHIHWWRRGGHTDMVNLLPLCNRHHHLAHEGGWHLTLHPTTRHLTITHPDGTTTTTTDPPNARTG